jgi:hypothetical protein
LYKGMCPSSWTTWTMGTNAGVWTTCWVDQAGPQPTHGTSRKTLGRPLASHHWGIAHSEKGGLLYARRAISSQEGGAFACRTTERWDRCDERRWRRSTGTGRTPTGRTERTLPIKSDRKTIRITEVRSRLQIAPPRALPLSCKPKSAGLSGHRSVFV